MKTICFAAAALMGIATAANATDPGMTAKADEATPPSTSAQADSRRYCVSENLTGTRIATKICQTRAEWARDGIDIDAAGK